MAKFLGLSIHERITWAVATYSPRDGSLVIIDQDKLKIPNGSSKGKDVVLHEALLKELGTTIAERNKRDGLFEDIASIGVSTLGVVNRETGRLSRIFRKSRWVPGRGTRSLCLVDFADLFATLFPDLIDQAVKGPKPLIIQNDSAALCILEQHPPSERLFYLLLDHGINGGMISGFEEGIPRSHPEIGHVFPMMHPTDAENPSLASQSNCPAHLFCYEGLASAGRIKNSWDASLDELDDDDEAWDIIAFYVAQLCMTGIAFGCDRIVIGGCVPDSEGRLLDRVRQWMVQLNGGYLPRITEGFIEKIVRLSANNDADAMIKAAVNLAAMARAGNSPLNVRS